jgi:hypothetical protein
VGETAHYARTSAFSLTNKLRSRNGAGLSSSSIARMAGPGLVNHGRVSLRLSDQAQPRRCRTNLSRQGHGHCGQVRITHLATLDATSQRLRFVSEHRGLGLESELIQKIGQTIVKLALILGPSRHFPK